MRIGLLHNTLNSQGGAERFTVTLMNKLREFGHEVIIASFDKPDWNVISENMGAQVEPVKSIYILPKRVPIFGIYQRTLLGGIAKRLFKQCDYTINTHSDHQFCKTNMVYIHGLPDDSFAENRTLPLWKRLYYIPHLALTRKNRREPRLLIENGTQFVSNSKYTSQRFYDRYGIESDVIYPPVDVEKYRELVHEGQKGNIVITIARASTDKNLLLIPKIIERTNPDIGFVLITHANTIMDKKILDELKIHEKRLNGRFRIFEDMNQASKRSMMELSKVYLHPSSFEHFGIALVEAISSGLKPVVINQGGHLEIIHGMNRTVFSTIDEAVELIESGIYGWNYNHAKIRSEGMNIYNENRFYFQMIKKIEGHLD